MNLYRIVTSRFVCGVLAEGDRVVQAAPIVYRHSHAGLTSLRDWVLRNNGTIKLVPEKGEKVLNPGKAKPKAKEQTRQNKSTSTGASSDNWAPVEIAAQAEVARETERAIMVRMPDWTDLWVPKSVLHPMNEANEYEDIGRLVVHRWWAKEHGFV